MGLTRQRNVAIMRVRGNKMKKRRLDMREWLVEARKKKGLTQVEAATKCGISRQYYNFIENGERDCPVKTAKKIAAVFDIPWTKFFE